MTGSGYNGRTYARRVRIPWRERAAAERAAWMAQFEAAVVAQRPQSSGRLCWHTAEHMYRTNLTPAEAARRYVESVE